MANSNAIVVCGLVVAAGLMGCGGSSSSGGDTAPSCELVSACGGMLEGSWKVVDFCPDKDGIPAAITQLCDSASLDWADVNVSGEITLSADKSFTQSSTAKGTGYLVLDAACLKQGDVTLTCAQVEEAFNAGADATSVKCASTSDAGCRCGLAVDQQVDEQGTYTVSDNNLTLSSEKSGMVGGGYCVHDQALSISVSLSLTGKADDPYRFGGQLKLEKR